MKSPFAVLAMAAALLAAGCASQPSASYAPRAASRPVAYAEATACCDDPSDFRFAALPMQGRADAAVDAASPLFDFQSGLSPFAAWQLPDTATPYRIRVKSLFDRRGAERAGVFYPVVALLDETFIVVHMSSLESLRLEPALATPGAESGLAVSLGVNPAVQKGKYLVVFTPAALLGRPPPEDREGDLLSLAALAYVERRGEAALPASPYGRLRVTVAPEVVMTRLPGVEETEPPGGE